MTSLRDALAELASDVRPTHAEPTTLWRQGRRRVRRVRLAAGAVTVGVVAAGAAAGTVAPSVLQSDHPPVAARDARPSMPDRLYDASPYLPGTDDVGAPGRIALLYWDNAQRRSLFGQSQGYVAVSAVDGSYRYLDVPGLDLSEEAALSPDGRYLAWPAFGPEHQIGDAAVVSGYRVYDAVSGSVISYSAPDAPYGIAAERPIWTPDSRSLVLSTSPLVAPPEDDGYSARVRSTLFDVQTRQDQALPPSTSDAAGRTENGLVLLRRHGVVAALDVRSGAVTRLGRVDLRRVSQTLLYVDPGARTFLAAGDRVVGGVMQGGKPVVAASGPLDSPATVRALGVHSVLGIWRPGWVVGRESSRSGGDIRADEVEGTGSQELMRVDAGFPGSEIQLAWDLVDGPYVDAPPPDDPLDPRATVGFGAATAAVVAGGVLLWRRRSGRLRA